MVPWPEFLCWRVQQNVLRNGVEIEMDLGYAYKELRNAIIGQSTT